KGKGENPMRGETLREIVEGEEEGTLILGNKVPYSTEETKNATVIARKVVSDMGLRSDSEFSSESLT
ncbi:MAG TPA: hypothetical protein VJB06_01800, partial [archaeon]|nr:hypothetical protein [archaeon]